MMAILISGVLFAPAFLGVCLAMFGQEGTRIAH